MLVSKTSLKVIGTVKKIIILTFLSWSGSHTCWGQPFRLCHMTTGRYMGLTAEKGLHLAERDKADVRTTSFCFRSSKVRLLRKKHGAFTRKNLCPDRKRFFKLHRSQIKIKFIHHILYSRIILNTTFVFTGKAWTWHVDEYRWDGEPRDQVWRLCLLCSACGLWTLAHLSVCRCQVHTHWHNQTEGIPLRSLK